MNLHEQFTSAGNLISAAKNILLIPHAKMDCDGMSAALSLYLFFKKLGKNSTAVCADPVPETLAFLPSTNIFTPSIPSPQSSNGTHQFFVTVDTAEKGFEDLSYDVKDGKINLVLFSKENPFEEKDFSFLSSDFKPDLIITVDSGDTKQLGNIYSNNIDLFESVPVINMDHHVSNTQFGDVNLVDMKSASTTEIIYDLLPYLHENGHDMIDDDIATLLLAGMLTDTGSFQHSNTTPKALDTAAILIEKGARHQQIIKHLFKTKSLSKLRLWGRLLTKMQNDPIHRIIWSSVASADLQDTDSHSDDSEGLIDELLATTPGTEMVLLIKEREDDVISTSVRSSSPLVDSVEFAQQFGGGGHKQAAGFKIRERGGKAFEEIVSDIIFEAKKFQAQRLHLSIPKRELSSLVSSHITDQAKEYTSPEVKDNIQEKNTGSSLPPLPDSLKTETSVSHETQENQQNNYNVPVENNSVAYTGPEKAENTVRENSSPLETISEINTESQELIEHQEPQNIQSLQDIPEIETIAEVQNEQEVLQNDPLIASMPEHDIFEDEHKSIEHDYIAPLSPEEEPFLQRENYGMDEPEKIIDKDEIEERMKEEENEISDFADFLSQTEEEPEQFMQENNVPGIDHIKALENIESDLHAEDNILSSLRTNDTQENINIQNTGPQVNQSVDPFLESLAEPEQNTDMYQEPIYNNAPSLTEANGPQVQNQNPMQEQPLYAPQPEVFNGGQPMQQGNPDPFLSSLENQNQEQVYVPPVNQPFAEPMPQGMPPINPEGFNPNMQNQQFPPYTPNGQITPQGGYGQ